MFQVPLVKKWKDVRYKRFDVNMFPEVHTCMKKEEDETQVLAPARFIL